MKNLPTSSTRPNKTAVFIILAVTVLVGAMLSICLGAVRVHPGDILRALTGAAPDSVQTRIILYARLPRTFGCLVAGAALAVSGAVIQSVLNNPLAAPNVIGVNSGAGLSVALCTALFPMSVNLMPLAAFLGALAGVLLVLFIARCAAASRITLVLAGIAVSGVFSAGIDCVLTFVPDSLNGYSDFRIGGVANLSLARVIPAFWVVVIAGILVFALGGEMDILALGSDTAQSLGLRVRPVRILLLSLAAALAGAAVSFTGLLGFVGLIVPHIMRRMVGEESRALVAACAMGGAAMLTLCDLLSRILFAPFELPVGIMLSLIGGPFFVWLLLKQRGGRTHD